MSEIKPSKACSQYGASMGRRDYHADETDMPTKFSLTRVRLDSGGYDTSAEEKTYRVLSIDARFAGSQGWVWQASDECGVAPPSVFDLTEAEQVGWFIAEGYISKGYRSGVHIDDDQCHLILTDSRTKEPLFAIEYGKDD